VIHQKQQHSSRYFWHQSRNYGHWLNRTRGDQLMRVLVVVLSLTIGAAACAKKAPESPQPTPATTASNPPASEPAQPTAVPPSTAKDKPAPQAATPPAPNETPAKPETPAPAQPAASAPATPPAPSAPSKPTASAPTKPATQAPSKPPASTAKPPSTATTKPATPAPAKPATPPPAQTAAKPATPPPAPASNPTLDLTALKDQLKSTKAIGLMTKLTLKNQVDDLMDGFRDHYAGKGKLTISQLRQSYDMLMMKVLSLLQDKDQKLASDIVASREVIWGLLADPKKFAALDA
jgi:hypothetical protein